MKVKIKGKDYQVKFVDVIEKIDDETETVGRFTKSEKLIMILKGKNQSFTAETIIHELTHAFLYECGNDEGCDNEEAVTWIARQLLDIFDAFVDVFEKMFPEYKGEFIKSKEVLK